MKKIVTLLALSATLAGCGAQPAHIAPVSLPAQAPAAAQAPLPTLGAAPADPDAGRLVPVATPAQDEHAAALATAKAIAAYGPVVTDLENLDVFNDQPAFGVQTTPEKTQAKADELAHAWASDSKQLWLAWGFKTVSLFGNSRHVYYSACKKRMLTIDFGFWGTKRAQYETTGLTVQYAGKLISALLKEPRDIYPVSGREAYNRVRNQAYTNPTRGTMKVILIQPYIVGPQWVFLDERNKPSVCVDANTGEVTSGGILLELLGYLF